MAESLIAIAREADNDSSSRPERRAARRELVAVWESDLAAGNDPCSVYEAIYLASTTF